MIEWANQNNGFVMVVLTFVYVLATLAIVIVTMRANKIALSSQRLQEQLEAQRNRPFVTVEFVLAWDEQDQAHAYVVVRNRGLTMAERVVVKIDPEPFYMPLIGGREVRKVPFMLTSPVPTLAPGQEVSDTLGYAANLYQAVERPVFQGVVTYRGPTGEEFNERFVIDWESMRSAVPLRRREYDARVPA